MKNRLTYNLGLKLISLVAAIIIWLIIIYTYDPVDTADFTLEVTILNEEAITSLNKVYEVIEGSTVTIRVKGNTTQVNSLKASDFRATADISKLSPTYHASIDVVCTKTNNVEISFLGKVKMLAIRLEDVAQKQFKVTVIPEGTPAEGYYAGVSTTKPNLIQVSGAESAVERISQVCVAVDVADATETFTTEAVPKAYDDMYDPALVTLPHNIGIPAEKEPPLRRKGMPAQMAEHVTAEEWRKTWAAHLSLTTMADDIFGKLVDELKQQGVYDNTCILFTSDHGDHLGQHRMYQKMEMYEEAIRVPLLLKLPKTVRSVSQTSLVSGVVSHLDIRPTLLQTAGIDPQGSDGISLLPLASGKAPDPKRMVFSQYSGNPGYGTIRRAAVTERYKYVYDGQHCHELYDLREDPHEMHNLAKDSACQNILKELYSACRGYHESRNDYFHWDPVS